jgi:hypothetical protein
LSKEIEMSRTLRIRLWGKSNLVLSSLRWRWNNMGNNRSKSKHKLLNTIGNMLCFMKLSSLERDPALCS